MVARGQGGGSQGHGRAPAALRARHRTRASHVHTTHLLRQAPRVGQLRATLLVHTRVHTCADATVRRSLSHQRRIAVRRRGVRRARRPQPQSPLLRSVFRGQHVIVCEDAALVRGARAPPRAAVLVLVKFVKHERGRGPRRVAGRVPTLRTLHQPPPLHRKLASAHLAHVCAPPRRRLHDGATCPSAAPMTARTGRLVAALRLRRLGGTRAPWCTVEPSEVQAR